MFFSSKPKDQGSPDTLPAATSTAGAADSAVPMDSDALKKAIIQQVLTESNTSNARQLIDNASQQCFERCVSKPGTSLSGAEETCVTQCLEKYISSWNRVNTTLMQRLQKEAAKGNI